MTSEEAQEDILNQENKNMQQFLNML